MSKFRLINTRFWDDAYVAKLSANEKLLFIYFISNPLTTVAGAYEVTMRRILFDTGMEAEIIKKILEKFSKDEKILYENGWVFVVNFAKNQKMNPNMKIGVKNEIEALPPNIKSKVEKLFEECGLFKERVKKEEKKPEILKLVNSIKHKNLIPLFQKFLKNRGSKAKNTAEAIEVLVEKVNLMTEEKAASALKGSIASGWAGLFPEKKEEKKEYDPFEGHKGYGTRNY